MDIYEGILEFVCSGNHTRGPVAEVVTKAELARRGEQGRYEVISSGISVDVPWEHRIEEIPDEWKEVLVREGLRQGIIPKEKDSEIEAILDSGDMNALRPHLAMAIKVYSGREKAWKREILPSLGVPDGLKTVQEQTIPRPGVVAVFPMDTETYEVTKRLYAGIEYNPLIEIFSVFAGQGPDAQISSLSVCGVWDCSYRHSIRRIMQGVPVLLDNLNRRSEREYGRQIL